MEKILTVEQPQVILCHKNLLPIGEIFPVTNFKATFAFADIDEITFVAHYETDGVVCPVWDEIENLRVVCIKDYNQHNMYFEIEVDEDQSDEYTKTIIGQNLCACELAQLGLTIEINTDEDLAAHDYTPSVVYDENDPEHSILNRILHDKAPHYSIAHVDDSLKNLQRTFSVNSTIDDFLRQDLATEIDAYVAYDTSERTISLYDLKCTCANCGTRYNPSLVQCPECGALTMQQNNRGYGSDTGIIISIANLTDDIKVEANKGDIKNTFRVIGGDDLITNYVQAVNPNGSNYITEFSRLQTRDMPEVLQRRLIEYIEAYNQAAEPYRQLMQRIFNCIEQEWDLQTKVPTSTTDTRTAQQQVTDLVSELTAPGFAIGLYSLSSSTSVSTINSAIVQYGKISLAPGYNLSVVTGNISARTSSGAPSRWTGTIKIIDDEEDDEYTSTSFNVSVNDDAINYIQQKIDKALAYADIPETYDLNDYGITPLESLRDGIQSCLDILVEHGDSIYPRPEVPWADQGYQLYQSYLTKYNDIVTALAQRESELATVKAEHETYTQQQLAINEYLNLENFLGDELYEIMCMYRRDDDYQNDNYISDGLTTAEAMQKAQELVDVAREELLKANNNQYSLSANLFNLMRMKEFAPLQDAFDLGNWMYAEVGEESDAWLPNYYISTPNKSIYQLRLVKVSIDYDAPENLTVEFSNVEKIHTAMTDVADVLNDAKSMSTSYSATIRQAKNGSDGADQIKDWIQNGLDATNIMIKNAPTQDIVFDEHGILCRAYDDISEGYDQCQMKIINSTIALTDDNWDSTKTAFGKYMYEDPHNPGTYKYAYGVIGDTIIGKLFLGEALEIINGDSSVVINQDGITVRNGAIDITGTYGRVTIDPNGELQANNIFAFMNPAGTRYIKMTTSGDMVVSGTIHAHSGEFSGTITSTNGTIGGWSIGQNALSKDNFIIASTAAGASISSSGSAGSWSIREDGSATFNNVAITGGSITVGNKFSVDNQGNMVATSGTFSGAISGSTITSSSGEFTDVYVYDTSKDPSDPTFVGDYYGGRIRGKNPLGGEHTFMSFDNYNQAIAVLKETYFDQNIAVKGNVIDSIAQHHVYQIALSKNYMWTGTNNDGIIFRNRIVTSANYGLYRPGDPIFYYPTNEIISLIEPYIKCATTNGTPDWDRAGWNGSLSDYGVQLFGNIKIVKWDSQITPQTQLCSLYVDGDITYTGSIGPSSSRKYKENIVSMTDEEALKLLDYDIVTYNYIGNPEERHGVIAEDAELVRKYGVIYKNNEPDAFSYDNMIPDLMKLCQIMYGKIERLENELKELRNG